MKLNCACVQVRRCRSSVFPVQSSRACWETPPPLPSSLWAGPAAGHVLRAFVDVIPRERAAQKPSRCLRPKPPTASAHLPRRSLAPLRPGCRRKPGRSSSWICAALPGGLRARRRAGGWRQGPGCELLGGGVGVAAPRACFVLRGSLFQHRAGAPVPGVPGFQPIRLCVEVPVQRESRSGSVRLLLSAPPPLSSSSSAMAPVLRFCCLLLLLLPPAVRGSFPRGGADCGPGKTADCPDLSEKKSDLRVCDAGTCRFGGNCRENGADIKCVCQFHCHKKYVPVCGSNGDTYQNECFLRRAACKKQRAISIVSEGPCYHDGGSGSADGDDEGSGRGKKTSKCGNCKFGAECDEDSEDVLCMCNIVCNGHNDNPVCGSDGVTYDTPCHVREASCLKQLKIDIKHVGRCQDKSRKDDGTKSKPDIYAVSKPGEGEGFVDSPAPCPEDYAHFCEHGRCEMRHNLPTCSCESAYGGPQCDQLLDFNVLYVVPSGQKLHYVLIAAIIGAVQIAVIVAVVMCFTRRCNKTKRGRRQKQHLGHFPSGTSSRMM